MEPVVGHDPPTVSSAERIDYRDCDQQPRIRAYECTEGMSSWAIRKPHNMKVAYSGKGRLIPPRMRRRKSLMYGKCYVKCETFSMVLSLNQ